MTITDIRSILESPYNRKIWKGFLQTQFTNNKLNAEDRTISLSDKTLSKQCLSLGNYEINEYTKIGIFEVELNEKVNIARNRVALRNLIKDLTTQVAGAMVVFVQGDKWRFSYISKRKVKNKETNEIQDKETAPKRYTYLFGNKEKALTAAIRFDKLIQKQKENIFQFLTLDDFEEAFSVEKLSKEFFKNYKNTYESFVQFLTGKQYVKKGNKYVEQPIHEPDWQLTAIFSKDEKQARDFCKRMMGRIVFLYFIQKKGWLAVAQGKKWGEGNPDYLYDLFRKSKYKDDFYARELVPLFFTRLNNDDSENIAREERFPYLNGGLFDDSQDRKYNKLHLPEHIFQNMFETFNNYNFTIYEDAPDEHTVAVDPEMLGHIFENLLEDNKDKGAFYTPKEIVHYMCKESLKAYLFAHDEQHFANNELAKQSIDKIIHQQELSSDEKQYAEKNAYKIIDSLERVKICDPAIGSGAFPMGLLQEIFNAQIYLQELKGFKKGVSDADIKKHIIEESIYGVDIDAGAVDIARLRFWLSLVVDEQEPQPLPNLDFKIVCANTLIPLGELTGNDMQAKAAQAVLELEKIRHDFFNVSSDEKLKLERQFKKVQTDLLSLRELTTNENYQVYTKLYEFNPFEDKACSWFDAWWMFGVKDGFDIIIGNPPYVNIANISDENYRKILRTTFYSAKNKADLYSFFIEKGFQLLKPSGVMGYIIPQTWKATDSFSKLREIIFKQKSVLKLVDLEFGVFDAIVKPMIVLMSNEKFKRDSFDVLDSSFRKITNVQISDILKETGLTLNTNFDTNQKDIFKTIELQSVPLDQFIKFSRGIKTSNDGRFINTEKLNDDYKQIYRGKNIRAYQLNWNGEYIWYRPDLMKEKVGSVSYTKDFFEVPEKLITQRVNSSMRLLCAYDNEQNYFLDTTNVSRLDSWDGKTSLKLLCGLLNSKILNYWYCNKYLMPTIGIYELHTIPIRIPSDSIPFISLVDYLLYLKSKSVRQIFSHTENERLASHIEEVLNMMVYELYFEDHMKENGLDVLQFISPKPISELNEIKDKEQAIQEFYLWYQKPENPVRQRMLLVETRSKDIIAVINKSVQ